MSINPDRDHRRTMRAFYARYGHGPWTCVDCDELIVQRGRSSRALNVHHEDGDVTNDDPANLVPLHAECHLRNRHPVMPEMAQQISLKLKGKRSPTKGKILNVNRTPTFCVCGAGPFNGPRGLHVHNRVHREAYA